MWKRSTQYKILNVPSTVLFVGGGQDSVALLYMYYHDAAFRQQFVKGHFVCIMADTGAEFPKTMVYVASLRHWCQRVGIEFYLISPEMGYHGRTWQSLTHQMERNNTIMGVGFQKSCTDQLKVQVCYRFLADWLRQAYGFKAQGHRVYYEYKAYYGKLVSWIGFAAGEEKRIDKPVPQKTVSAVTQPLVAVGETIPVFEQSPTSASQLIPVWRQLCVCHEYPLVTLGMNRAACQRKIAELGHQVPIPSNCMLCPFQSPAEIVYLYRAFPQTWTYWVEREQAKLAKFKDKKTNLGVKGKLNLTEYLQKALLTYGTWSIEQLETYRFSHGHCVMSRY